LIGTGGPVLTMYLTAAIKDKRSLRATLIFLIFVTSVVRLGISARQDLFTPPILHLALLTLPFFLAAIALGANLQNSVSDKYYRLGLNAILALSAVVLVFKAVY
jgi:uncharacterized membrane protein YfcA